MSIRRKNTTEEAKVEDVVEEVTHEEPPSEMEEETQTEQPVAADRAQSLVSAPQTALAEAGGSGSNMSEAEMGELDFGFGAFPIIVLDGKEFACEELEGIEDGFDCSIVSYRTKTLYIPSDESEFIYSYDNEVSTKGDRLVDIFSSWEEEKLTYSTKKYFDVTVLLTSGQSEGEAAVLSIAPRSVPKFSAYVGVTLNKIHNVRYTDVITHVAPGNKINKTKFPYTPWSFTYVK